MSSRRCSLSLFGPGRVLCGVDRCCWELRCHHLAQVREELAAIHPEVKDIPILSADPSDDAALDSVIGKVSTTDVSDER